MSTTLAELITAVRDRIDEVSASRWEDAEIARYINTRVKWLQSRIDTFNSDYFLRVETATAAPGSNGMGIPIDIHGSKVRSIRAYEGQSSAVGQGTRLQPGTLEYVYTTQYLQGTPQRYTMMAGQIKWGPSLQQDTFFRFVYAVRESPLTGCNSTLEYISDEHTDLISDGAAIDCLIKTGAWDNIKGISEIIKERLLEVSEDVQTDDPIQFVGSNVDDYSISD